MGGTIDAVFGRNDLYHWIPRFHRRAVSEAPCEVECAFHSAGTTGATSARTCRHSTNYPPDKYKTGESFDNRRRYYPGEPGNIRDGFPASSGENDFIVSSGSNLRPGSRPRRGDACQS